ncbi:hypothetical protein LIA77_07813 [Sarocladium implicatum]|nr:hypothetical protein LIA77_07813 [Sarocladium implicatum]
MPDSFRFLASIFEEGRTIVDDDEKDAMLCLEKAFSEGSASELGLPDAVGVWDGMYSFDCSTEDETVDEKCKKALTVATKAIFHAALATADVKTHRDFLRGLLRIALVSSPPRIKAGASLGQLTGQDLERSVAFLGDCIKDDKIMMHLNHKIDLVDGLFDCIVWGLEDLDSPRWMLYHASLFIQASAGPIFAKSIQQSSAQTLCQDKDWGPRSPFAGPPGFSLERWAFWTRRLNEIRETWVMTPIAPGFESIPHVALWKILKIERSQGHWSDPDHSAGILRKRLRLLVLWEITKGTACDNFLAYAGLEEGDGL